jgi:hypothetical protein
MTRYKNDLFMSTFAPGMDESIWMGVSLDSGDYILIN